MPKSIKNLLLKLMNVVSVLIILASITALLKVVLAKPGEAPNFFGYSLFRVMTGSMEPTIPTNSLIVVQRTDTQQLAEGDIITFYSRDPALMGEPNTHRIIRFEQDGDQRLIYTKGDANNIEDHYAAHEEDVIGKVVYSSEKIGNFVRLVSNPVVFIPLIIIPLAIMLIRSMYDGIVAAKKLAKEEEEAAVREALAELREKRKAAGLVASAGEANAGDATTDEGQSNNDSVLKQTSIVGSETSDSKLAQEIDNSAENGVKETNQVNKASTSAYGATIIRNNTQSTTSETQIATSSTRVATMNMGERVVTTNDQKQWKARYGVRQRSQKRKQLHGGKWNR